MQFVQRMYITNKWYNYKYIIVKINKDKTLKITSVLIYTFCQINGV